MKEIDWNIFSKYPWAMGTIWMRAGSKDNEIEHAQIKNGIIGILIDSIGATTTPTLKLEKHRNFQSFKLWNFSQRNQYRGK